MSLNLFITCIISGFSGGSVVKESACNAGDLGSNSGLGRFPGGGNGNPLQSSCLGNPMDRGTWQATVHGVAKELDTTWRLKNIYMCIYTLSWLPRISAAGLRLPLAGAMGAAVLLQCEGPSWQGLLSLRGLGSREGGLSACSMGA